MQNDTPHSQSTSVLDMSQTGKSQQTKHEMQRRSEQTFIQNSSLRTLEKMWMLIGKPMFRRKSRKPVGDSCSCQKSQCLKLYCQCFSKGKICNKECSCKGCLNKAENQIRSQTISQLITKDPLIFSKKQISTMEVTCNCHRSKCRMKYCECFKTGNLCGSRCKCSGCENQVEKPWYSFERQFARKKVKLVQ